MYNRPMDPMGYRIKMQTAASQHDSATFYLKGRPRTVSQASGSSKSRQQEYAVHHATGDVFHPSSVAFDFAFSLLPICTNLLLTCSCCFCSQQSPCSLFENFQQQLAFTSYLGQHIGKHLRRVNPMHRNARSALSRRRR